jgi:hypothetical protein
MTFRKIAVDGKIHLGMRLELVQEARTHGRSRDLSFNRARYAGLDAIATKEANALGEILDFRLSDKAIGDLHIEGAGLVTSYGIFGAPGSGKTVLLMYLLKQVLGHAHDQPDRRYGALILDPKAALIAEIEEMAKSLGREDDLVVVNTQFLNANQKAVNAIDCHLDPQELGAILVLAGRSAGVDASDPFWFQEWSNLFASSLGILKLKETIAPGLSGVRTVTLDGLLGAIFDEVPDERSDKKDASIRRVQQIARDLLARGERVFSRPQWKELQLDTQQVERFFRQDYVGTIEAFITKAFGMFRRPRLQCYSAPTARIGKSRGFYEDIIEKGKIVLVSVSPSEPVLAKTLCTLIKCLFQRTVLARRDLLGSKTISNAVRPLVLACDEFSEIASEVPGQSMGDGQFLALSREYGCMALLATQSVHVLEASTLKDAWRSVVSNFGAKIYMRLADNETAEEATKLAGESDWRLASKGQTLAQEGSSVSKQQELRERKNLPGAILTQILKTGEAVVIGSLDGGRSLPGTFFMRVPFVPPAPMGAPSA